MGTTILLEDSIREILYSETQSSDAEFAERVHFGFAQCSRLAFESNFLSLVPRNTFMQAVE